VFDLSNTPFSQKRIGGVNDSKQSKQSKCGFDESNPYVNKTHKSRPRINHTFTRENLEEE
jgi:hypothetical protein